ERILRIFGRGTSDGERRKLGRTVEQFDEVLNAFGMRGRRVTPQELEWLLFRSVALCMAPPGPLSPVTNGQWDTGDLLALTEQVERYRTPYGSTVKLVNRMTGEERHVAVLSVGRMEPLEIPEKHEPWLHFHERLPWPMELSSRIDILGSGSSFRNLEHRLRLIQLYSRELRISLQHPKNQDQLAREFIPGEPIANTGYVRRMPVKLLAAALPQAASTVGDRRGDLIARRGVQVTLLDPSGPLARLCQMPELRPYSRVLNLTGSEQGTLAPYALIPTPVRSEFATGPGGDREFEIAVSNARAERRMLVQDICSMLVPPQVAKEASTATLLLDTAEMPLALLFFGSPPKHLLGADAALTVITMAGLRLPDLKIEREY